MTRRLATIGAGFAYGPPRGCCLGLAMMFLVGTLPQPVRAQKGATDNASLKGIGSLFVAVEEFNFADSAARVGLTHDSIQTDVELKLRLAGISVVALDEGVNLPGVPFLYVQVTFTRGAEAASITVELDQSAFLERNGEHAIGVATWRRNSVLSSPNALSIRTLIKDHVDQFLNAWLSVNPKQ
jgi:hypothetical protein